MKRIVLYLAVFLPSATIIGQEKKDTLPVVATLQQCIQYALVHQPELQQAGIDEQLTEYAVRNRLADWYPQIGAAYSFQRNFQRQTSFFNGVAAPAGVTNTSTT